MSNKNNTRLSRRRILKGAATGALVAFVPASASANRENVHRSQRYRLTKAEEESLLRDYRDPNVVHDAVHRQSDVLEALAADGVIEAATIDDLEELTEPSADTDGEILTTNQLGDRHTPRINVIRRVEDGYLSLSVFPEEDTAHAVMTPEGDGDLAKYGSLPKPEADCDSSLGLCETCDCQTVCCIENDDGTCIAKCDQCDCYCECCDCNDNSCVYAC